MNNLAVQRSRYLIASILVVIVSTSSQAATLIFSDDFEGGSTEAWTEASAANTITQERVYSGAYAVKYNASNKTNGNMRKVLAARQQIFVRFRWYPTSNWECGQGAHFWRIGYNFQTRQVDANCLGDFGSMSDDIEHSMFWGRDQGGVAPIRNIPLARWNLLEYFFKLNDVGQSNGELKIWLNGTQVANVTGQEWRDGSEPIDVFHLNSNYNPGSPKQIWYFDDVEIWDGMPPDIVAQPPKQPSLVE